MIHLRDREKGSPSLYYTLRVNVSEIDRTRVPSRRIIAYFRHNATVKGDLIDQYSARRMGSGRAAHNTRTVTSWQRARARDLHKFPSASANVLTRATEGTSREIRSFPRNGESQNSRIHRRKEAFVAVYASIYDKALPKRCSSHRTGIAARAYNGL